MENQILFVKYLENQPVKIETHYSVDQICPKALSDVADVIGAFQSLPASPLADVFLEHLTLHSVVDGVESVLVGNNPLSSIPAASYSFDNPLIINSERDTITMDKYMVSQLPDAVYINAVTRANTTNGSWNQTIHVFPWSDFEKSVNDWIEANHLQHSERVKKPNFIPRNISDEVQTLQPFIFDNLLEVSSKCFIKQSQFQPIRTIESCVGEPDYSMVRNGEIVAPVEVYVTYG